MNLLAARVVLRPRSLGDVLDLAVPFCLANRRSLSRLALTSLLPAFALCCYLRFGLGWSWGVVWLLAVGLADLLEGLFTVACGDLLFQPQVKSGAIWARFGGRFGAYLGSWLVARLLLLLTVLFAPLAPFVAVRMMFGREAVLLEGAGVLASIARANRFVQRQAGASLGLLVALLLAPALMACGAELLGDAIVDELLQLGSPWGELWKEGGSAYALLGFFLSVPVVAGARFLKYIDVRTRKEGWDIQLRFTALAAAQSQDNGRSAA